MELYELTEVPRTGWVDDLIKSLVRGGILRKVEKPQVFPVAQILSSTVPYFPLVSPPPVVHEAAFFKNPYIGNGMPIESNFESIAKLHLGVCEEQKDFKKKLSTAVKEFGHDELIEQFYDWTLAQSGKFTGRKPVEIFLRTAGQNIMIQKPAVTNPLIDRTEKAIALLTDNQVFFTGEYRVRLALLLKEHGLSPVNEAFAEFWNTITDDRQIRWASREFLQRADVMISTIKSRELQKQQQMQSVSQAYQEAKENVEEIEEEDEEL